MHNRQAQACAFVERAVKRLKNRVQVLRRNPAALILHRQQRRAGAIIRGRRSQQEAASLRHRLEAIRRQVPDHLSDLILVSFTPHGIGRHVHTDRVVRLHFRAIAQEQCSVLHYSPDIELRQRKPLRSRIGQERLNRLVEPFRLAQDDVHQLRLLVVEGQLVTKNLNRARHRGERIPDLVGNAGRHLAHRRKTLL